MNVLFVHRGAEVASARVRILDLLPHLEASGIACRAVEHPRSARALRELIRNADGTDAFVLQKKLPTPADAWAWRARRAPLVFDYDDAVMYRQEPRRGSYESRTRRRRFRRALRICDAFVCGNAYLAAFAAESGKPVLVAPSAVPLDVALAERGRAHAAPVRIGWLGSPGNLGSLASLAPALRAVAERRPIRLVVVSEAPLALAGVPTEHVPWTLAAQQRDLAGLDIGVMPLEDSPWSRGKCAYKLLQYMACGLPVVSSPVGMGSEVVRHGENGLLASTDAEWRDALLRLIDEPDLALRLARAGRETARAGFGYPAVAAAWRAFLGEVARRPETSSAGPTRSLASDLTGRQIR